MRSQGVAPPPSVTQAVAAVAACAHGVCLYVLTGCGPPTLSDLVRLGPKAVAAVVPDAAATVKDVTRWLQMNSQYLVKRPE